MSEIFNRYRINPPTSKLRDRALEVIKVAWAGEENDTPDPGRGLDGIVSSLGEHLRVEEPYLRPKGSRIVPEMAQKAERTIGTERQKHPLTMKGDPDEYKMLFDYGSNLSTMWWHFLHFWKQALSTHHEEKIGKTDNFVFLLSFK
jgi:hypothetical protein